MSFCEKKEESRRSHHDSDGGEGKYDDDGIRSSSSPSNEQRSGEPSPSSGYCDCSCHEHGHDGHRPCLRHERSSSRLGGEGVGASSANELQQPLSRTLSRIRSRPSVPPFSHPLAKQATGRDALVDFDGPGDPYRPANWPTHKKVSTTLLYGLVTMTATWASSSYAAGTEQVAEEFGVGRQVATLGTALFLLGFGIGPLLWAPLSEVYGRRVAVRKQICRDLFVYVAPPRDKL